MTSTTRQQHQLIPYDPDFKRQEGPRKFKIKATCLSALEELPDAVTEAYGRGIGIRVAFPMSSKTATAHLMLDDLHTGKRLADYWPGPGTLLLSRGPARERRRSAASMLDAVEAAASVM